VADGSRFERDKKMEWRIAQWAGAAACATMLALGSPVLGAPATPDSKATAANTFRASKLMGLHVKNAAGEKLGTVDDFVMDVSSGKIAYVAMGVGGVLGIGEKLFAVPYSAFTVAHDKDGMSFVLDTTKEKLQASPGFDKANWPDFADPKWTDQIDNYYREADHPRTGKVLLAK
jgi:sporulation protein YlmC with PRC-barrel domain